MIKLGDLETGKAYAIVPVRHRTDRSTIEVHLMRLTEDQQGNEFIKEIETLTMSPGQTRESTVVSTLKVALVEVLDSQTTQKSAPVKK